MSAPTGACSECAAGGNGACCKNANIPVTTGDLTRITQVWIGSFWEYRQCHRRPSPDDPLWNKVFRRDGAVRMLLTRADGHCYMLDDKKGCRLSVNERPLVCRLYPYERFSEDGLEREPEPSAADCPPELSGQGNLAEAIGVRRVDAVCWHAQLYAELATEP